MIVGIVIILIATLQPDMTELKIFGIDFKFSGRTWVIWLGLTIWYLYAVMRGYSYYRTNYYDNLIKNKRRFIYWEGKGKSYWTQIAEARRREVEKDMENELTAENERLIIWKEDPEQLLRYIERGEVPGIKKFKFERTKKHKPYSETSSRKGVRVDIDFAIDENHTRYFRKRKREYRVNEPWWEFTFLRYFVLVSGLFLLTCWYYEIRYLISIFL